MTPGSRVFDVISAASLRNLIFYLIKSWIPLTESVGSLKLRVVKVNVPMQPLALQLWSLTIASQNTSPGHHCKMFF